MRHFYSIFFVAIPNRVKMIAKRSGDIAGTNEKRGFVFFKRVQCHHVIDDGNVIERRKIDKQNIFQIAASEFVFYLGGCDTFNDNAAAVTLFFKLFVKIVDFLVGVGVARVKREVEKFIARLGILDNLIIHDFEAGETLENFGGGLSGWLRLGLQQGQKFFGALTALVHELENILRVFGMVVFGVAFLDIGNEAFRDEGLEGGVGDGIIELGFAHEGTNRSGAELEQSDIDFDFGGREADIFENGGFEDGGMRHMM